MNMTIYDKMKDIAILKATGFAGRDIRNIFIIQSLTIGFFGGLAGLLIGFLLSLALGQVPFDSGGFLSIDHYPINYDPRFYMIGMGFGMVTTFLAGYFPSRKASKVDPVSILRG
ncbi:MAG: FtsX-like permease family protein, partial [Cytophagales bacterium]|nr:FtsX-like permease family protein [Cytophagales bacterium]